MNTNMNTNINIDMNANANTNANTNVNANINVNVNAFDRLTFRELKIELSNAKLNSDINKQQQIRHIMYKRYRKHLRGKYTKPSLSQAVSQPCDVKQLNVNDSTSRQYDREEFNQSLAQRLRSDVDINNIRSQKDPHGAVWLPPFSTTPSDVYAVYK